MSTKLRAAICVGWFAVCLTELAMAENPIAIGMRRELLVDDYLIGHIEDQAALQLHQPTAREIVMVFDQPWEGNSCGAYNTVFVDGDRYRMYYGAGQQCVAGDPPGHPDFTCYAESKDGIHWVKPNLGQFEFAGSKKNNILMWKGYDKNSESIIVPFKDPNPACKPAERYKAVANIRTSLHALKSPDGLHWSEITDKPVITKGAFDSLNLAFWDPLRHEYRAISATITTICATSVRRRRRISFTGANRYGSSVPAGSATLYKRRHAILSRPAHLSGLSRGYTERGWNDSMRALPGLEHRKKRSAVSNREGMAVTDGLFMSSRDGLTFHRWSEAFIRPGLRGADNWVYGDNYQTWGLLETKAAIADAPDEMSLYATEGYWVHKGDRLRRFTIRKDGFVSMHAAFAGGQFTTKPITFQGNRLSLNFSTSAAGTIRVEIRQADGKPIDGFALSDSSEVFGDDLQRTVTWKHGSDMSRLAGKPVRLRFTLSDADLYSFQFQ